VTISTSCVWPKGWFNLLCLLQSTAMCRTHSSRTLHQKMHKQQTCVVYKWAYSLCRHLCLCSDVISKKMRDTLKPSHHCNEEPYNIEFCTNLGPAGCDIGTFLMHAERKTAWPRETFVTQPTNTKARNLVCSQAIICLLRQTYERMLRRRAFCRDCCTTVCVCVKTLCAQNRTEHLR